MSEKKIRILINGPLPPPIGGMATYCQDYMKTQLPSDFDITLCRACVIKWISATSGLLYFGLRCLNSICITIVWLTMLIAKRPDIAHIHTNSYTGFYVKSLLVYLARMFKAKTILHVHGAEFKEFYSSKSNTGRQRITRLLNRSDKVIALSEQWKTFFVSIGVDTDRIKVMTNSIFLPDLAEVNQSFSKLTVLFMSLFQKRKGIQDLITAVERTPQLLDKLTFVLAGPKTNLWNEIAKRVKAVHQPESIEMPGPVFDQAKDTAYRNADIYILPSYDEGLPIGLLEAMSHGLACITTPVGGIPEVIENMQNGLLIDPGDVDSLARAIDLLVNDRDLRNRLGAAARRIVQERYNWQDRAKEIKELYLKLVNKSAAC